MTHTSALTKWLNEIADSPFEQPDGTWVDLSGNRRALFLITGPDRMRELRSAALAEDLWSALCQ